MRLLKSLTPWINGLQWSNAVDYRSPVLSLSRAVEDPYLRLSESGSIEPSPGNVNANATLN
jgi:hypothetical protein